MGKVVKIERTREELLGEKMHLVIRLNEINFMLGVESHAACDPMTGSRKWDCTCVLS